GEPWPMLTAYDMYTAELFDEAGIPVLLVGDSASNNVYGYDTSLPVTVDELVPLVRAVTRSVKRALVVADLPFGSYQLSPEHELAVPTVGIGAGPDCDAQVLVWQDMAGLRRGKAPRFVKRYADMAGVLLDAARQFSTDVRGREFPAPEHVFH